MSTDGLVRDIAAREGWTDDTLLGVLLDYLANQGSDDALADYLTGRCDLPPFPAARRSCSCGNAWADEPGHDDDAASGSATCQDLTVSEVGDSTWPPGTRFRPVYP